MKTRNRSDTSLRKNYGSYGTECLPYLFLLYLRTLIYIYIYRVFHDFRA